MYGIQSINTLVTARDRGDFLIFGNLDYHVGRLASQTRALQPTEAWEARRRAEVNAQFGRKLTFLPCFKRGPKPQTPAVLTELARPKLRLPPEEALPRAVSAPAGVFARGPARAAAPERPARGSLSAWQFVNYPESPRGGNAHRHIYFD
jgi:hypothetical protein